MTRVTRTFPLLGGKGAPFCIAPFAIALLGSVSSVAEDRGSCRERKNVELAEAAPQPYSSLWTRSPLAAEALLISGGRLVLAGAGLDWALSQGFSLQAAGGWSESPGAPFGSLVGRVRLVLSPILGAGAEAGFVVDRYETKDTCTAGGCRVWTWDPAVWGKVGVHTEVRTRFGFTLRVSAGATSVFNMTAGVCRGCQPGEAPRLWTYSLPYFGLAAGWVLGS